MIPPYYEEKTITFTAEEISLIREYFFKKLLNFETIEYCSTDLIFRREDGKLVNLIEPVDPSLYMEKRHIENIIRKLDE